MSVIPIHVVCAWRRDFDFGGSDEDFLILMRMGLIDTMMDGWINELRKRTKKSKKVKKVR